MFFFLLSFFIFFIYLFFKFIIVVNLMIFFIIDNIHFKNKYKIIYFFFIYFILIYYIYLYLFVSILFFIVLIWYGFFKKAIEVLCKVLLLLLIFYYLGEIKLIIYININFFLNFLIYKLNSSSSWYESWCFFIINLIKSNYNKY